MGWNSSFQVHEKPSKCDYFATAARVAIGIAVALAVSAGVAGAVTLKQIKDRGYIRIAFASEAPGQYVGASGEIKGSSPVIIRHVLKQLGIDPENIQWVVTNFSSLIPGLQANRFDMTASGMAIRPERCQKVIYSEPYTSYGEGLLVAKDNPKHLHSYLDFKKQGMKVAVMAGADQLQMLQKVGIPEGNIVTIATNADAVSTVATGRADAYAATGLTASELAKKSDKVQPVADFKDPVIDGKAVRSWGGFNFNKDSTELRDQINVALAKFMKTSDWKKALSDNGYTQADINAVSEKTTKELCSGK